MHNDGVDVRTLFAMELCIARDGVLVSNSVETIAPDIVFPGELVRNRIVCRIFWHAVMKGRIEHRGHRRRRSENLSRRANAADGGWIMQRCELAERFKFADDFVIYGNGRAKFLAAMHDPMAGGVGMAELRSGL